MKSKLVFVCLIATIPLLVPGCSTQVSPQKSAVEVSCDDFYNQPHITRQVEVAAGGSLTVTLCSNPTTGFQWAESATISDQSVLQQTDHKFTAPEGNGTVGAPGKEVWTFKALKKGTSTVSIEYSRTWEGGEKGEWTFSLTVVVK